MAEVSINKKSGSGLWGLAVLTTIIFFILKLTGVIAWSWWLVFLPLLIAAGLSIIGFIVGLIILAIVAIVAGGTIKKNNSAEQFFRDRNRRRF